MSMSNFSFLSTEFADVFEEAQKAESFVYSEPRYSAILSRSGLEKMLTWLYSNDRDLAMPYDTNLNSLMNNHEFKNLIDPQIYSEINLARRIGNKGAHGGKVNSYEALTSAKHCFRFYSWVSRYYSVKNPSISSSFDETIIPKEKVSISQKEIDKYLEATEKAREAHAKLLQEQEATIEENKKLRLKLEEQTEKLKQRKEEREALYNRELPVPSLVSEAETRTQLIDILLYESGWTNLVAGRDIEYEVKGMPLITNPSGRGYVDYVLWDDNGKPLAIVEAKSTTRDANVAQHQAKLYANCLEDETGQRPIIYYSNGFKHYIWDDTFYPPREVSGFHSKSELKSLIHRRSQYKDLRKYTINKKIAGRAYQMQAIRSVADALVTDTKSGIAGKSRKALLVMATGTGKTRTAAAIVEMLLKENWAKRVLFLADRNALVSQAKDSFKEHLPNLSAIDLTKEKDDGSARLVFSTYPTILNRIDNIDDDGQRIYGIGHFDLIIIDEAHRSVYQKYQAIFEYFDSLLIGLTATPINFVERNTFELFGRRDKDPTYAYSLEQAVSDGFLVPPKGFKVPVKFPREGIIYADLSQADKNHYSELFGVPVTNQKEFMKQLDIKKSKINSLLFNKDTVDIVLDTLITYGQRVDSGDKLGKTIIFAKNHKHAEFIKKRFDENYGYDNGNFMQVIDNYSEKAEDLIKDFCFDKGDDKSPQIAVSVDMLDTGIDAPRVLNLVFFKEVYSRAKYWQMIGRGTRLCPNVFGTGKTKEFFLILDVCGNLEYFKDNPDGFIPEETLSISQRIFKAQLELIYLINTNLESSEENKKFAIDLTNQLHSKVKLLDEKKFAVRRVLEIVKKYKNRDSWSLLNDVKIIEMANKIGDLIVYDSSAKELTKQFDLMIYKLNVALLGFDKSQERMIQHLKSTASKLETFKHIPSVIQNINTIKAVQSEEFWETVNVLKLEKIRKIFRELVLLLKDEKENPIESNFKDELSDIQEVFILEAQRDLENYKERVENFIHKNKNHLVINKIYRNIPITSAELKSLEEFLTHEKFDIDKIESEYETKSLGAFVRKILGLDIQSAQQHFADFIEKENLNTAQMEFVKMVINYLNKNGIIDKKMLTQSPFTNISDGGIFGTFKEDAKIQKFIRLIDNLDENIVGA